MPAIGYGTAGLGEHTAQAVKWALQARGWSVRPSVRPSVRLSVCLSVCLSIHARLMLGGGAGPQLALTHQWLERASRFQKVFFIYLQKKTKNEVN